MSTDEAIEYIRAIMEADKTRAIRAGHYFMVFATPDDEFVPYDTKTLEQAYEAIKKRHPEYRLLHIEPIHNSAAAIDLCKQVRTITEMRRRLFNKPLEA